MENNKKENNKKENDKKENNLKILEETIKEVEKQFGKGSIFKLNSNNNQNLETIPTGSMSLDIALGIGGYPKGRIIEIFGPESSGKTTLTLHAIAEAQKLGGNVAFIDAEHALDSKYAKAIGVNIDELVLSQPDSGEKALDIATSLIKSGSISLLVIDSVAALTPESELMGEMKDINVGLQARMMGKAMRIQSGIISKTNTVVIYINQLREKVGNFYGNPEVTTGGKALKFFCSLRLDIRRTAEKIKNNNDEIIGVKSNIKIVKSKVSTPFKTATIDIIYGKGISKIGEILDLAVDLNLIKRNGAWYNYKDENIAQGKENAKIFLQKNLEIYNFLEEQIRKKYKI
ncbi:MAG: recombinase RecA [Candidatus Phytoplasma pyri]|uniref:recombinase RecA n=1 Tax=Candidatus Phytoplasma pyri TaxID=47566 RepID=UPI0039835DBF